VTLDLTGKILAPFLGAPYAEALAASDIRLDVERLSVLAHDVHRFPLRRGDHAEVRAAPEAYDPATPDGRERLHALLERQHYRLAWWRTAGDAINWRRFFDITELAALRIEDSAVFEAVHELPLRLYREGLIDGLRVDHVDGLSDPPAYCRRLRQAFEAADPQTYAVASRREDPGRGRGAFLRLGRRRNYGLRGHERDLGPATRSGSPPSRWAGCGMKSAAARQTSRARSRRLGARS
jgi:maltooligosyltrehalose synthase